MNILYYSIHAVLEYDELTMLRSLGHTVFPLGFYFRFEPRQAYRPALVPTEAERRLVSLFDETGCHFDPLGPIESCRLTDAFLDAIDVVVVMHSLSFISIHWHSLSRRPVVWRTIGQAIDEQERNAEHLRKAGLKIVRYSPRERRAPLYRGEDAVIRFGSAITDTSEWRGDVLRVVNFNNSFAQRYPVQLQRFLELANELDAPLVTAGDATDGIPNALGWVSPDEQVELLRSSRAYLYCTAMTVPYTLTFVEAWLAGIPVVVLAEQTGPYFEVDALIDDGRDGFITRSLPEAAARLNALIADRALAERIGREGRASAHRLFGQEAVGPQWQRLLQGLTSPRPWPLRLFGRSTR